MPCVAMKLTSRVLALAAVVATALLGSTSAGVLDGPCTITADMSTLTGTCPAGLQDCIASVQMQSSSGGYAEMVIDADCKSSVPYVQEFSEDKQTYARFLLAIKSDFWLQVYGSDVNSTKASIAQYNVTAEEYQNVCQADAKVTTGVCLYSEREPLPSPSATPSASAAATPSPAAHSASPSPGASQQLAASGSSATAASTVLAAVIAGAALLLV